MPLQGEYLPSPKEWVSSQVEQYEGSGGTEGLTLREVPVIVVTSVGAKSGKLRKNPVMRVAHDGAYLAVASEGGLPTNPAWYFNLKAHPLVEVQDQAVKGDFVARERTGEEREVWWQRAIQIWPDYVLYQMRTDRVLPLLLLEPAP